ncbi:MAG: glycosyl transferase [Parcubacteria group bacterium Gr01-1014_3]|nr:MAG: glycosyl transferase [Parcubacteria group bacterium Gr01-1014_3]
MQTPLKIIGIILAYNAEKTLADLVKRIPSGILNEIFVADDGSTDQTVKIAEDFGLRVFSHPNLGYGGNLKCALQKALQMGADYIVEIHGDNQYDPQAIFAALAKIDEAPDLISGSRFTANSSPIKDGMPTIKYLANKFLSWFDRMILKINLSEFHSGFRVYGRNLLESVPYQRNSNNNLFTFQIITQAVFHKLAIEEIPVVCEYHANSSSLGMWKSIKYAVQSVLILFFFLMAKIGLGKNFPFIKF